MLHSPKVIEVKELLGGLLSVKVRCCEEESTDSVLTLGDLHRSEAEIDADIANYLAEVAARHQASQHAKAHIERLMK